MVSVAAFRIALFDGFQRFFPSQEFPSKFYQNRAPMSPVDTNWNAPGPFWVGGLFKYSFATVVWYALNVSIHGDWGPNFFLRRIVFCLLVTNWVWAKKGQKVVPPLLCRLSRDCSERCFSVPPGRRGGAQCVCGSASPCLQWQPWVNWISPWDPDSNLTSQMPCDHVTCHFNSFYIRHPKQMFLPLSPTGGFLTGGRHALEESICMRHSSAANADSRGFLSRKVLENIENTKTQTQIQHFLHSLGLTSSCNSMIYCHSITPRALARLLTTWEQSGKPLPETSLITFNGFHVLPLQPKKSLTGGCYCNWKRNVKSAHTHTQLRHPLHSADLTSSRNNI